MKDQRPPAFSSGRIQSPVLMVSALDASRSAYASPVRSRLSSQHALDDVVLEHLLGKQLLQPDVLRLQLLTPLGIRHAHAAKLAAPQVVRGLAEAMPASASRRKPMIYSSESRFFTSNLLIRWGWTPYRPAAQNRGDVGRGRTRGNNLRTNQLFN